MAELATNTVDVNSGSGVYLGRVRRLFELILGSVMLIFSDVQGYEELATVIVYAFVYVLFNLSTWIYYVKCYSYTLCINYLW